MDKQMKDDPIPLDEDYIYQLAQGNDVNIYENMESVINEEFNWLSQPEYQWMETQRSPPKKKVRFERDENDVDMPSGFQFYDTVLDKELAPAMDMFEEEKKQAPFLEEGQRRIMRFGAKRKSRFLQRLDEADNPCEAASKKSAHTQQTPAGETVLEDYESAYSDYQDNVQVDDMHEFMRELDEADKKAERAFFLEQNQRKQAHLKELGMFESEYTQDWYAYQQDKLQEKRRHRVQHLFEYEAEEHSGSDDDIMMAGY